MPDTTEAALDLCERTGLPYALGHEFRSDAEGADGPHLLLRHEGTRKIVAGGRAWKRVDVWGVSLYSAARDPHAESLVEAAFDAGGTVLSDSMSGYDDESRVHWVEWHFELVRQE